MAVVNAAIKQKSVADPCSQYQSMQPLWEKSRAVIGGERYVKDLDGLIDVYTFSNLLLPFSSSMTQQQYNFYKSEAELPGIVSQYSKLIIGGLLRKQPQLVIKGKVPEEAHNWIMNEFGQDGCPLTAFMDEALLEEIQTSRAWVYVDYPKITNPEALTKEDFRAIKPYPVLWNAESVINWRVRTNSANGKQELAQVIVRDYVETFEDQDAFHPTYVDTVWVHELVEGYYQIRVFEKKLPDGQILVVNGRVQQTYQQTATGGSTSEKLSDYILVDTITTIMSNGERLCCIPAWPLNGSIKLVDPILTPIIDKEVSLYNKISRRNHLLYGAATYTPIICSDMSDDQFDEIVSAGLGSWLKLMKGDTATVLETPTAALVDMDRAIANTLEEMAKLGIRMLSPESAQSGVALEIRNAAQTAQLGTLNTKISNTMTAVIVFMLNWRYGLQLRCEDVEFELSSDFNPAPLGADWLRLATEWYQGGLIPRSIWLMIIKQNDIIAPDYDDEEGQMEINQDSLINPVAQGDAQGYQEKIKQMAGMDSKKQMPNKPMDE